MIIVYGIPNCDSVKKAKKWLADNGVDYQFHDFRKDGLDAKIVTSWLQNDDASTDLLLNKRSTTWKQLSVAKQDQAATDIIALLVEYPTLIKRPVLHSANTTLVGFNEAAYQQLLNEDSP